MEPTRHERRKERTRNALIAAAVELFDQQGYDATTVAQIAERADVSTRTFFLHFPTKEDVLLPHVDSRIDAGARIISDRGPDEGPDVVLVRAVEHMLADTWERELPTGIARARALALRTSPALRARMLQRLLAAHEAWSEALLDAFGGQLDETDATAAVGAAVGAVTGAVGTIALTGLQRQQDPGQLMTAMRRAGQFAARAIAALFPPETTSATSHD